MHEQLRTCAIRVVIAILDHQDMHLCMLYLFVQQCCLCLVFAQMAGLCKSAPNNSKSVDMTAVIVQQFSTFGTAVNTCFAILLGDISVNDDLNQLQGLQGVAATLFFWSFELLVFMVLLNFLLAIIVDAFSEVKENTHETTGTPSPTLSCKLQLTSLACTCIAITDS